MIKTARTSAFVSGLPDSFNLFPTASHGHRGLRVKLYKVKDNPGFGKEPHTTKHLHQSPHLIVKTLQIMASMASSFMDEDNATRRGEIMPQMCSEGATA